jgi:glutamate racemase
MSSKRPVIGIFDSGLGGLTVVKALVGAAPGLSIVYFGDTARFPYGTKGEQTIVRYSHENTQFLLNQGAELIIVACNTATATALPSLQSSFSVPIFGVIRLAAQEAAHATRSGRIGVIATSRTIKTQSYTQAILQHLPKAEVTAVACPLLVSMIEDDCPSEEAKRLVVREYLRPLKENRVDTLLLGCTHYPLIESLIREEMGPSIAIVDPAKSCAAFVATSLPSPSSQSSAQHRFFASDDIDRFQTVGESFLGIKIPKVELAYDYGTM